MTTDKQSQYNTMRRYYRWQSRIYDATRWSFLYGRESIIPQIPFFKSAPIKILEVGSGTGRNLVGLAKRFPNADITGLDVSEEMVKISAQKVKKYGERIRVKQIPYEHNPEFIKNFDIILFSYSLSMINPQWHELLLQAKKDLKKGGYIVVVDFHNSKFNWFKKHMSNNHVLMDGHLLPVLEDNFSIYFKKIRFSYLKLWSYIQYIGKKECL